MFVILVGPGEYLSFGVTLVVWSDVLLEPEVLIKGHGFVKLPRFH